MPRSYIKGDKTIVVYNKKELASQPDRNDWERVDAMSDEELTTNALSDPNTIPAEAHWEPKLALTISELLEKRRKRQVTLRLDQDIVDWFKMQDKGYQTLMNEALKTFASTNSQQELLDLPLQRGSLNNHRALRSSETKAGIIPRLSF
jgi:uncharacterized protein (DUF4415 family)